MTTSPKPKKPYPDFPLTPHNNGRWCKKIKGKIYYFGTWENPDDAMQEYIRKRDYLYAGVQAPSTDGGHSILEVLDRWMISRAEDVRLGEIAQRTHDDYHNNCQLILSLVNNQMVVESMGPLDFANLRTKLLQGVNATTGANRVRMAKTALRYVETLNPAFRINFGKHLREPSAKLKRKAKMEAGKKLHTAQQIREAVAAANPSMKAMLLLGINCAFGNSDCARLTWDHLDLEAGWHTYWREKTYVERKAKLWPETVAAIKRASVHRSGLVFKTKYGNAWTNTAISHEAQKLGIEFYTLRRTFRTVADSTLELMAIRLVMGHAASATNMDHVYVQEVVDTRLDFVSQYVRAWYLK